MCEERSPPRPPFGSGAVRRSWGVASNRDSGSEALTLASGPLVSVSRAASRDPSDTPERAAPVDDRTGVEERVTQETKPRARVPDTPAEAPAAEGRERRRFTRVALDAHVAVTVLDSGGLFHSRVRDLSENGVFIVTESTRAIGTNIRVSITVKDADVTIDARGIVVHEVSPEASGAGRPPGMGVMFTELSEEARAALRRLVAEGTPLP